MKVTLLKCLHSWRQSRLAAIQRERDWEDHCSWGGSNAQKRKNPPFSIFLLSSLSSITSRVTRNSLWNDHNVHPFPPQLVANHYAVPSIKIPPGLNLLIVIWLLRFHAILKSNISILVFEMIKKKNSLFKQPKFWTIYNLTSKSIDSIISWTQKEETKAGRQVQAFFFSESQLASVLYHSRALHQSPSPWARHLPSSGLLTWQPWH